MTGFIEIQIYGRVANVEMRGDEMVVIMEIPREDATQTKRVACRLLGKRAERNRGRIKKGHLLLLQGDPTGELPEVVVTSLIR